MNDKPKRLWIIIDHDDNPWGPFDDMGTATKWATKTWGSDGWDVVALREPD